MNPSDGHSQSVYSWPVQHSTAHLGFQAFSGHPLPINASDSSPTASSSLSPMYVPLHLRIFQPASHIVHFHGQPGPEQHSYPHLIHQNYAFLSNQSQASSSNVVSTPPSSHLYHQPQQQQTQYQIPEFYQSNFAMLQHHLATDNLPAVYDETALHFIDYSQPHTHLSSSGSNFVSISLERPQMTMRKHKAHYTNPHSAQVAPGMRDHRQNELTILENQHYVTHIPALTREERSFQEDITSLAENSTITLPTASASQALSMWNPSSIETHPYHASAMKLPLGLNIPQPFNWAANNEEQMQPKPETYSLGDYPSLASQIPLVMTSMRVTPPPTQGHTTGIVFIHSNIPQVSTNFGDENEDYGKYKTFFPNDTDEHRKLRIAMHDVMTSEWKARNELEPTSWYLLQFSVKTSEARGNATFRCLLYHKGEPCDGTWSRDERILAHLRKAIDLRPFACERSGKAKCNCNQRFFTEDTLKQHRKNIYTIKCEYCNSFVTPRNKKRHQLNNCSSSPSRVQRLCHDLSYSAFRRFQIDQ